MKESPILGGVLRTGLDLAGNSAVTGEVHGRWSHIGSLGQAPLLGKRKTSYKQEALLGGSLVKGRQTRKW